MADTTKTDWTKGLDYYNDWSYGIPKNMYTGGITGGITNTPVLCKDGTTKNQLQSATGKYADACAKNGGRAENQPMTTTESKPEKSMTNMHIGLFVGGIVIGYFLFKMIKK